MLKRPYTKEAVLSLRQLQPNGCMTFTGRGRSTVYGIVGYKGKYWTAHRLAWILEKGEIPAGLCVCHSCDNPLCMNTDHLWLGTNKQNSEDMVRKNRQATGCRNGMTTKPESILRGSKCYRAKITEDVVKNIKIVLREQPNLSLNRVASIFSEYKVSAGTVHHIKNNKAWKHVVI